MFPESRRPLGEPCLTTLVTSYLMSKKLKQKGRRDEIHPLVSCSTLIGSLKNVEIIKEKINQAIKEGIRVNFDQYPYAAYHTSLLEIFPCWAKEGGSTRMLDILNSTQGRQQVMADMIHPSDGWDNPMTRRLIQHRCSPGRRRKTPRAGHTGHLRSRRRHGPGWVVRRVSIVR